MTDLRGQLRAYGRLIEADLSADGRSFEPDRDADAAEGPAPVQVGSGQEPGMAPRSRRSALVLVAAATAAVVFVPSLLVPASPPRGGTVNNKTSGVVLGTCLFAAACTSTPGRTNAPVDSQPSAAATSSATAEPVPGLFDGTPDIAAGTYAFDFLGVPMHITVPAGWVRHEDFYLTAGPEETSSAFLSFLDVTDVYKDPCHWNAGKAGIGPTVADLVTGLQAQPGMVTSAPAPLTVDGFTGTQLTITTPADVDLSTCYTGTYALWTIDQSGSVDRQIETTPGGTGTLWILDLNGKRGVISFASDQPTSETGTQIQGMLDSLKIG